MPGLRPGMRRRIVWAGAPAARTPFSVVVLHGFSASSEEIRPVPDILARALGASLHFARFAGHGQNGAALAAATAEDWLRDAREALALGARIGERVIALGVSTGGTLAALAADAPGLAGIGFVSPNFGIRPRAARLLGLPYARRWLPRLAGPARGFAPRSDLHARFWTIAYPPSALFEVRTLVVRARRLQPRGIRVPALFIWCEDDVVVDPRATARMVRLWGGPAEVMTVDPGPGDDPAGHVIAGDILSPGLTAPVAARLVRWAAAL